MKQKKDWTDGLRDRMKGAQMTPPDGGWARLEKELGGTGGHSPVSVPWKRVAVWTAAAAAVLAVVFFAIPDSEQASPLTSNQSPLLQEGTGEAFLQKGTGEATGEGLQIPLLDAAGLQIRPNRDILFFIFHLILHFSFFIFHFLITLPVWRGGAAGQTSGWWWGRSQAGAASSRGWHRGTTRAAGRRPPPARGRG